MKKKKKWSKRNLPPRRSTRSSVRPERPFMVSHFCCLSYMEDEPATYEEAVSGEHARQWRRAMDEEMQSLIDNKTYEITSLPTGREAVTCKWVYKVKRDKNGEIDRFKARLVARGFTQKKGIDYEETFSPTPKFTTIRLVIAIAVRQGMALTQMDFTTAFLNGTLDEEIYMAQAPGYVKDENQVYKLLKSLYGLKQASRAWNVTFNSFMIKVGFKQCESDLCLYFKHGNGLTLVICYVDDLIIASNDTEVLQKLKDELQKNFMLKYTSTDNGRSRWTPGAAGRPPGACSRRLAEAPQECVED